MSLDSLKKKFGGGNDLISIKWIKEYHNGYGMNFYEGDVIYSKPEWFYIFKDFFLVSFLEDPKADEKTKRTCCVTSNLKEVKTFDSLTQAFEFYMPVKVFND